MPKIPFEPRRVAQLMSEGGCDALLAYTPRNFQYVTGFQNHFEVSGCAVAVLPLNAGDSAFMVIPDWVEMAAREATWIKDIRTTPVWMEVLPNGRLFDSGRLSVPKPVQTDFDTVSSLLAEGISERNLGTARIGIESGAIPHRAVERIKSLLPRVKWVDATNLFEQIRAVKTDAEIELLRSATSLAEHGIRSLMHGRLTGSSPYQLRLKYQEACVSWAIENGEPHFQEAWAICWAAGRFSRVVPEQPIVQPGDVVFVDCGAVLNGYSSDIGRSFVAGRLTELQRRIATALKAGIDSAVAMVRPGVRMCDVYNAAQSAIREHHLDGYTRGHIGHSIGLGVGEFAPWFSPREERELEPGMVLAIETPLYVPGLGGFQFEDDLVVTDDGCEVFNRLPRELFEIDIA